MNEPNSSNVVVTYGSIPTNEVARLWNNGGVASIVLDLLATKPSPSFADGDFSGTCTATSFVGNGSGLTNVNPDTGEDYTWTGENTFDGDVVMASNVDFTGLPTSDPNTAGRLYNDSGTLKVSSGGSPPP